MADTGLRGEEKDLSRLSDVFITKRMEVHRYVYLHLATLNLRLWWHLMTRHHSNRICTTRLPSIRVSVPPLDISTGGGGRSSSEQV